MKHLFILLLILATGCHSSKTCRPNKNYNVNTYLRYGHKKTHGTLTARNKNLTGYFGHGRRLEYLKKTEVLGVLEYYDTCRTMIKEAHLPHSRRHSVSVYYDPMGVKTKKTFYRNGRTKTITWDKWGKRTVSIHTSGRMY